MQIVRIETVQGDSGYDLNFTLQDYTGTAINLTGATLTLKVQKENETAVKFTGSISVVSAVAGTCKYTVQSGDLSETGEYDAEIEVTISGQTFTYTGIKISVRPQLPKT